MMKYKNEMMILIGSIIFYLLFNWQIPITDPVEANYAITAKEMLLSGDLLSMRIYGQYWYDKPAMIYWLIIASYKMFGINAFAARFPMVVAGACSLSFLYWFVNRLYQNTRIAWTSVGVLATSFEFWIVSKMVITDSILFLFDGMALGFLFLAFQTEKQKYYYLSYSMSALAVLTKGPIGIVLPAMIAVVYLVISKKYYLLKKACNLPAISMFFVIALPWYLYMYLVHGNDFIAGFLGLHNVTRAMVSEHPKDNVIYYYLVVLPICLLPWSGIFIKGIYQTIKERYLDDRQLYLYCWIGVTVVFYTFVATKYLTYIFIVLFPAAILIALQLEKMLLRDIRKKWLWLTIPVILLIISLILIMTKLNLDLLSVNELTLGMKLNIRIFVSYIIFFFCLIVVIYLQLKGKANFVVFGVSIISMILIMASSSIIVPHYANMRSSEDIIKYLPQQGEIIASYGNYQNSVVFYRDDVLFKIEEDKPESDDDNIWGSKYDMPKQKISEFAIMTDSRSDVYVLVDSDDCDKFERTSIGKDYTRIARGSRDVVYKKKK
ncbi:MAG: hypothetical protein H6Q70_1379 [Firmicutes bacterium]|nr:hypothetical protein [Bacillota bacterium]